MMNMMMMFARSGISKRLGFVISGSNAALYSTTSPLQFSAKKQKGMFSRMWDRYSIEGQQRRIDLAERLFRAAQIQANDPRWYGPGRIGRNFRPRHALLTMHVWFLHKRLISDKVDPHFSLLVQEELFDFLWNDTQSRIRAEGVNELTVNKHLKDTQQVTFQHLTHYDHAYTEFETQTQKRFEEVSALIWIHILLRDEEVFDDQLKRLALYIEAQYENIVKLTPDEYFWEGRIAWIDLPDFTGMRDRKGKRLPDLPPHPDDVLPKGWYKTLTDAGKTYYWNPERGTTQYERPT